MREHAADPLAAQLSGCLVSYLASYLAQQGQRQVTMTERGHCPVASAAVPDHGGSFELRLETLEHLRRTN